MQWSRVSGWLVRHASSPSERLAGFVAADLTVTAPSRHPAVPFMNLKRVAAAPGLQRARLTGLALRAEDLVGA